MGALTRTRLAALLALGCALVPAAAARADNWTSGQIIAAVNGERAANGIPGDLVENATYTQDCAAHDAYAQANGGFDSSNAHGETKANATQAGIDGGSHSVLAAGAPWSAADPWESAPYHLLQVMNPRLLNTGADESGSAPYDCLWTIPTSVSDERPAASTNTLYSFPGDGRTDVPWFEFSDSEYPQSPNDTLGIPRSQATGFDIQVYWDGPGTDLSQLCAATLTAPGGAVATQIINNAKTPSAGPDSGLIVPTQPLEPSTQYSVSATFSDAAPCDSAHEYSHSFSFTTAAKQPASGMMHVDDKTVSGSNWTVPFHVDQPLARGSGKVMIDSSGYLAPGSYTTYWPDGSFDLPPPPSGQWVRVSLENDPYTIGDVTWGTATVSKTFGSAGLDTTAPTITLDTPADGAHYTQGETVDASYSCADEDGGSGVAKCAGPVADGQPIDTSATGQHSFEVDATDNAGNPASKTVSYTVDPPTPGPPKISISSPTDGAHYDQGSAVTASYSCQAQGSFSIDNCTGPVPSGNQIDTGTLGQHSFEVDATDNAQQRSSKTLTYTVDAPPNAILDTSVSTWSSSADQTFSFHSDRASATFKCDLDGGGVNFKPCSSGIAYSGLAQGSHTFSVEAVDPSGSTAGPATASWGVDTIPPKLELDNPVDGGHYVKGQVGNATYFCSDDGGSGVAACDGTVAQMQPLDDSVGTHSFTATARDNAGNSVSKTVTYYVDAAVLHPGDVVSGGGPSSGGTSQPGGGGGPSAAGGRQSSGGGGGSGTPASVTKLTGSGGGAHADSHGKVALPGATATCGPGPCTVSAVAVGKAAKRHAKPPRLAASTVTLQTGQSGQITLTLARSALARVPLHLTVTLTIVDATGTRLTRTVSVTVTPAPHKRKKR